MTHDAARRGGWRWRALRRTAVLQAAAGHLDDPDALAETLDPARGGLVPTSSPWFAVRTEAIRRCALAVLADPLADTHDRHCTRRARVALVDPHEDAADSAIHGPGGVGAESTETQVEVLHTVEAALAELGYAWVDQDDAYVALPSTLPET